METTTFMFSNIMSSSSNSIEVPRQKIRRGSKNNKDDCLERFTDNVSCRFKEKHDHP